MDVVQNVTSIFTAGLLQVIHYIVHLFVLSHKNVYIKFYVQKKDVLGSRPTNVLVAPYFLIPILIFTYMETLYKNDPDVFHGEKLINLARLIDRTVQEEYSNDLKHFKTNPGANVLNKIFVGNEDQLRPITEIILKRIGFDIEKIDMNYKYVAFHIIQNYLKQHKWTNVENLHTNDLTNNTLIILNGASFHGDWTYPYDVKYQKWIRFWVDESRYKLTKGMHFEAEFPFAEYCDMRMIALPYTNSNLSLLIVLPNTIRTLNDILNQLDRNLNKILKTNFKFRNVNVDLPIFEVKENTTSANVIYKVRIS